MRRSLALLLTTVVVPPAAAAPFALDRVTIVGDSTGMGPTGELAATMLADDLVRLGATRPRIVATLSECRSACVVLGHHASPAIARIARRGGSTGVHGARGGA